MRRQLMRRLAIISAIIVFTSISMPGPSIAFAQTSRPLASCQHNDKDWFYNAVHFQMYVVNDGCQAGAKAQGYISNCNSVPTNVNVDVWETRTWPGGTRYGETGRTGDITYPSTCGYYWLATGTLVNPALADVSWGCGWEEISDNSHWAYDYLCQYFPNNYP